MTNSREERLPISVFFCSKFKILRIFEQVINVQFDINSDKDLKVSFLSFLAFAHFQHLSLHREHIRWWQQNGQPRERVDHFFCHHGIEYQHSKGPVTMVDSIDGRIIAAIGQKVFIHDLNENDIRATGFVDTQIYTNWYGLQNIFFS